MKHAFPFLDFNHEGIKHIFIDEFFEDFHAFEEQSKEEVKQFIADKQTAWVALSNSYFGGAKRLAADVDIEQHLKSQNLQPNSQDLIFLTLILRKIRIILKIEYIVFLQFYCRLKYSKYGAHFS